MAAGAGGQAILPVRSPVAAGPKHELENATALPPPVVDETVQALAIAGARVQRTSVVVC